MKFRIFFKFNAFELTESECIFTNIFNGFWNDYFFNYCTCKFTFFNIF